jgi:16S rRNA processing protein RimM
MADDKLRVGVYTNTHGVHGEIKVYPTTDDVKRFKKGLPLYLDTGKQEIPLKVERVKYFKNMVILKFEGIDSINDIERYKGHDLLVSREHAVPLAEDEYFICDAIGSDVVDENGVKLGVLKDVMQTGANDVFVITLTNGKEALFPVIPDCVKDVDTDAKKITVHVMKGLLD